MNRNIFVLAVFMLVIFVGCASKQTSDLSNDEVEKESEIPKGSTSIVGSIVSIDSTKLSVDKKSPCSKAPCWAEVEIKEVLGNGQGGPVVNVGDKINVNFKFTLSKTTEELIPNLDKRMPGLHLNDSFKANLLNQINTGSEKTYSIYYYEKM